MRSSQYFIATKKEIPAEAENISHQLMLRTGMIRKLAAGIYTWLPLGLRVLNRVANIVREEMDAIGGMEMLMPNLHPAEIWQETGRWDNFNPPLLKVQDRHQREFCFAPTHEECFTEFVRANFQSYKQLPAIFYQVQTKFRDEPRPRSGVLRGREFLMKDAYSLHADKACLQATYDAVYQAYTRIFDRLGLTYYPVLADTGSIGGSMSHEFQVIAESGEDRLAISTNGTYAANLECATTLPSQAPAQVEAKALSVVDTPNSHSIAEVSALLKVPAAQCVKTLIVQGTQQEMVALVLRGDHELNELKAEKHPLIASPLTLIDANHIQAQLGCPIGSLGPIGLDLPCLVDHAAAALQNFVCGANQNEKHYLNANWQRDANYQQALDLRSVVAGDPAPNGDGELTIQRGIEVGHIFQLDDKYSSAMQATVLDQQGKQTPLYMGCYGIGVSRIVAAAIEQHHDEHGIIWPQNIAPFQIALVPINLHKSQRLREACDQLYQQLTDAGFSVLYEDRNERPGVLFADMDLIGIPHRLVMSERGLDAGTVEYKARAGGEVEHVALEALMAKLGKLI
jgi:prolyl-tRNA synthetase